MEPFPGLHGEWKEPDSGGYPLSDPIYTTFLKKQTTGLGKRPKGCGRPETKKGALRGFKWASQVANGQEPACQRRRQKRSGSTPGPGRALEEGTATHSRILAWRSPRTEGPAVYSAWGRRESGMTEATQHTRGFRDEKGQLVLCPVSAGGHTSPLLG